MCCSTANGDCSRLVMVVCWLQSHRGTEAWGRSRVGEIQTLIQVAHKHTLPLPRYRTLSVPPPPVRHPHIARSDLQPDLMPTSPTYSGSGSGSSSTGHHDGNSLGETDTWVEQDMDGSQQAQRERERESVPPVERQGQLLCSVACVMCSDAHYGTNAP